ncbi:hypothetical protein E2K80_11850 [Rhodophyticola sp. CCM32]|uniref:IclR family transcriptional regulator domain-containing protein n=1 Tax=Rhodophyticola sp. CCM32 TaxID=2916397 RepID=UPI00107F205D|nr:IclR family transcriptional regulator C-terminal domain-containing protein [Rhodophyticola sp. CCM32]QBY01333.1 hypothetical protein E2K80_11850 [Rhodophyticola sp. CCM32]
MNASDTASTFVKGLRVLDSFETGRTDLTMAEIARLTEFDRSTVRRLCLALEEAGYLTRQNQTFRLTPKIVAVAGGYLTSHAIGMSIQPVLNQFAEELRGELAVSVMEGTRAVYIARSAVASARMSLGFSIGSALPLLPTAVGRMLLAGYPAPQREDIIQACRLYRYTDATDMDLASIRAKVEAAAQHGYVLSTSEFEQGASGIAVPIRNIGETQAVLSTTASVDHFRKEEEVDRVLDILRRTAMSLRA